MIKKSDEINREIYTISEFAKMTGVSTDTLRYYDKINLFKPTDIDPKTGYRYYTLKEFEEIGVIQTLQTLGVSLKEIKYHLENKTFFSSYMLLSKQYADIDRKIAELIQLKSYLSEKLSTLEDVMNNNSNNEVIIKDVEKRVGYGTRINCKAYGEIKTESARIIEKYRKSLFVSNSYAIFIPKEDILKRKFNSHYYCVIFDIEKDDAEPFEKLTFPKGLYATIRYNGTTFERADSMTKLVDYIEQNHHKIIGDALQICVIDENITNIDAEKINEIQIPIEHIKDNSEKGVR